MHFTA